MSILQKGLQKSPMRAPEFLKKVDILPNLIPEKELRKELGLIFNP
jgi:hypothetical protein